MILAPQKYTQTGLYYTEEHLKTTTTSLNVFLKTHDVKWTTKFRFIDNFDNFLPINDILTTLIWF